ncbi:MAG: YdcF family protein [Actinobacteria bacterium]|nr:YdcF family protein [Actinomycetota bacterium]MSW48746.1 YdcF family protein [Actinomycetota bacterium]
MSRFVRIVGLLMIVSMMYGCVNLAQVWWVGRSDQARSVDAIVVLGVAQYDGRPSPQLQARLDHALELWQEGLSPLVITTGGNQPGDRFTEAETSANYLIEGLAGVAVPAESIVQENTGSTTRESLIAVRDIMQSRGLHSVLIVTDPYHSLRSRLIAQDLGLVSFISPTRTSPLRGASAVSRHVREAIGVAVAHLIGFANLERLTK